MIDWINVDWTKQRVNVPEQEEIVLVMKDKFPLLCLFRDRKFYICDGEGYGAGWFNQEEISHWARINLPELR